MGFNSGFKGLSFIYKIAIAIKLQFIIHFLPVSSGFHMDTRTFRSLLRVVYSRRLRYEGAIVVCYITDDSWRKSRLLDHEYNAIAMTRGAAAMLCPGFCTGSWQKRPKRSKRVKYCGSIHILRLPPEEGGDVCKVRLRSVQKCGFV